MLSQACGDGDLKRREPSRLIAKRQTQSVRQELLHGVALALHALGLLVLFVALRVAFRLFLDCRVLQAKELHLLFLILELKVLHH